MRLAKVQGFEQYQHRNNNFDGFCKYGKLMRLDFRKSFENGVFAGYHHLEISISPHYHFNNYLHNGNDFTPKNCINTIVHLLDYLEIEPQEYEDLKVVNIEFGLNIIPETDIENLVDSLLYYKKTTFVVPEPKNPYFKITDTTKHKSIKAYAKGLQFVDYPEYAIAGNTFRFEVKSKKSSNIEKYGINKVNDLLKIETYQRLGQELINEWGNVFLLNQKADFSNLKSDEVQFIKIANKTDFWIDLYRVKFGRYKEKYSKILKGKNNIHSQIKRLIIDKLFLYQNVTFFPQPNRTNTTKDQNVKNNLKEIKGQNVTIQQNNRVCLVTKLDISMQRKGSKFLCIAGLKWFQTNDIETYKEIELKYLSLKMKTRPMEEQIYYLAHNIRNNYTNPKHNPNQSRKRFENRNYKPNQLQLFND
ncbi:hypothetical protein [Chryseobacterium sp. 5_R23647]|uniref:hypothetical protein n=1 Tax=Chryseobacterium sp. 5_R23647 TaxID=2258964 RepID=UPI000F4EA04A|nr:hypothetical protein [Chryseobacterium sp. 5_R23647]